MSNTLAEGRDSLDRMQLPSSMSAVEITDMGPNGAFRATTRPVPRPKAGEVLIRVEAIGVCRPDSLQRRGMHPPPAGASDLPGLEVAGTIALCGEGVDRWKPADAVCALLPGGGYAGFAVSPQQTLLPIPQGWSAIEAATLPENFFTVWDNVFHRARLAAGEILLAHGGTSGIGSTAIMLALAFGARALATAGSEKKCEACLRIGAEKAINYRTADFVPAVLEHTGGRGVDVVVDIVGRDYVQRSLDVLATEGRLVHLATQGPDKHATLDMSTLLRRRATIVGSALRHRTPEQKGAIAAALLQHVWPKLPARSPIAPLVDSVHPLRDAARVHEYFDSSAHIGKIVLTP
jgi:putative PIG3 family NAD(P)H quinone oxidoreductase